MLKEAAAETVAHIEKQAEIASEAQADEGERKLQLAEGRANEAAACASRLSSELQSSQRGAAAEAEMRAAAVKRIAEVAKPL